MTEKSWFWRIVGLVLFGLIAQFTLFRILAVYQFAFKTHLYDTAWWVEKPAETLIMGGSSAMNGVIPNMITDMNQLEKGSIVNLGMNGATLVETHVAYKKYVKRFGHPKRVYFVISPTFYYESFLFRKNYEKIFLNFSQWQVLQSEGFPNHYFFPIALFAKSLEFHQDYNFMDYHFNLEATRRSFGFQANSSAELSKEIASRYIPRNDSDFGVSKDMLAELKKWVRECDQHKVEFILLMTPFHKVLYEDHVKNPDRFEDVFKAFKTIFSERVILGSFNPDDYKFNDSHFLNLDHLTLKGAEVFTEQVFGNYLEHPQLKKSILENTLQ